MFQLLGGEFVLGEDLIGRLVLIGVNKTECLSRYLDKGKVVRRLQLEVGVKGGASHLQCGLKRQTILKSFITFRSITLKIHPQIS